MLVSPVALAPAPDLLDQMAQLDQAVLDALPVGVCVCDAGGRIVRVNCKAEELWDRKPRLFDDTQRFCGSHRVETLTGVLIPPDATPMAQAVRHGASFRNVEARVENPDGRRWIASVSVQPLTDNSGAVIGAINCFQDITREFEQREMLLRRQKSFDLAMTASKMGTWRYTMADNVCIYDENAQRLYGLNQANFLHDAEGVKEKFHADDMDLMWSRVAKAVDPAGDGLYDVEYRVKQLDGTWKWLSAWGYVEFEGEGDNRKPVAITGASRDISELIHANDAQRVLINELNHRVKNTLATVQSLAMQTQRSTPEAFRERFEARLMALSRSHDLLTRRQWTGAALRELLDQALLPFATDSNLTISMTGGDPVLCARDALALGMVMHELATNAAKYGALSKRTGRVNVDCLLATRAGREWMTLLWIESGGPPVEVPRRRGFGSRLIQRSIAKDLGGETELRFAPSGLECRIAFPLARFDRPQ